MNKDKKRRGFTLVELLVVLLILGVLVGLAVPRYMESQKAARVRTFAANVRQITSALEAYRVDQATATGPAVYPDSLSDLTPNYFTQEPINPYTGVSMLTGTSGQSGIEYVKNATTSLDYTLTIVQPDVDDLDDDNDTSETLCKVDKVKPMLPSSACTTP